MARKKGVRKPHLVGEARKDLRSAWTAAPEKAGLDSGLRLHDLRRTPRTRMKMAGVDSLTWNEIMGHANPKIENVDTRLDDDQLSTWHRTYSRLKLAQNWHIGRWA
jgi:integrase